MGAGKITVVSRRQPKKKVLTNKALTRQVRALSGKEGARIHTGGLLYSAVTLTAGTADINYFDDATLFFAGNTSINHYYDCSIKLLAAAQATVRILYCFDEHFDGTNLVASEIFETVDNSASNYLDGDVNNMKEAKNKNRREQYRCVVVRDMIIALEAGVPKAFRIRFPLFNRKSIEASGANQTTFLPFILALADESNVTFSMGVDYMRTNLPV